MLRLKGVNLLGEFVADRIEGRATGTHSEAADCRYDYTTYSYRGRGVITMPNGERRMFEFITPETGNYRLGLLEHLGWIAFQSPDASQIAGYSTQREKYHEQIMERLLQRSKNIKNPVISVNEVRQDELSLEAS